MVVYKITNLLNEKIYIGQTKQMIEKRFLQHSKANSPLGQAMRECGLENFTIEIIERCENQNELNEREKFWIKILKSKSPNGYNLSSGGNGFVRVSISEKNNIGKILQERRKELSLTQRQIADYVGVTEATVSRWESGEIDNMRRDKIAKLASVLRVSPLLIMELDEEAEQLDFTHLTKDGDETKLLAGYRVLDDSKRQTLFSMLAFLSSSQGSGVGTIVQNNTGNNSFLAVGNGNNYINTAT